MALAWRFALMPILSSLLLLLVAPVAAWNEPDNFRGVPWGASEEIVKDKNPQARCSAPGDSTLGDRVCVSSFTIGDVPVKAVFGLRSNAFVGVTFTFDPKDFSRIEAAFKDKYGNPTDTRDGQKGLEYKWVGEKVNIVLQKYVGNKLQSYAIIQTSTEAQEGFKRFLEKRKKGADDL